MLEPDDVVVHIEGATHLRSLPPSTQGALRGWVTAAVGADSWERATALEIRLDGRISLWRYTVAEDGGYLIDPVTGSAAQDQLVVQAPGSFPVHIIGIIRPDEE